MSRGAFIRFACFLGCVASWGVLTLQAFQSSAISQSIFKIRQQEMYKSVSPTMFVDVSLIDPTLVKTEPQRMYVHVGFNPSYNPRGISVWSKPIDFSAGASKSTVEFDREFSNISFQYGGINWICLTTGPSISSKTVGKAIAFSAASRIQPRRFTSTLFLYSSPPLATGLEGVFSDDPTARLANAPMWAPQTTASRHRKSNFLPQEMPTLQHVIPNLSVDASGSVLWSVSSNGNFEDYETLVTNGYYFGDFEEIPQNWAGLAPYEEIFISEADIRRMRRESPEKVEVLGKRIAAGGQLVVTECTKDFAIFRELQTAMSWEIDDELLVNQKSKPVYWLAETANNQKDSGIKTLELQKEIDNLTDRQSNNYYPYYGYRSNAALGNLGQQVKLDELEAKIRKLAVSVSKTDDLADASHASLNWGRGSIILTKGDLRNFSENDWMSLREVSAGCQRVPFEYIAGLGGLGDAEVYQGVPGVGKPPLFFFLFLATGFTLLIGPGCLIVLGKFKKRSLILLLVPLISFGVTLLLAAYGILVDGFDYRVCRISSSYLDQDNQILISHSENAVFSGRQPQPLKVENDTVLLPYRNRVKNRYYYEDLNNIYQANTDESSTVVSGRVFKARQLHQVATLGVRRLDGTFRISMTQEESSEFPKLNATNGLGFPVELAIAKQGGKFYIIKSISEDAVAEMVSIAEDDLKRVLNDYLAELRNESLDREDIRGQKIPTALSDFSRSGNASADVYDTSIGQTWRQSWLLRGQLDALKNGEFWLVARDNPWVEDLNPRSLYQYQIHFIFGRW
jgi:hypothetical protein